MKGIAADPLAWSAITAVVAIVLWLAEHHFRRVNAWLFMLSSAFLVTGWGELRGALASLLGYGKGMVALVILFMLAYGAWHMGAIRAHRPSWMRRHILTRKPKDSDKDKKVAPGNSIVPWVAVESPRKKNYHHRVWTNVAGIVTGALGVIVVGGAKLLAVAGGKSLADTGRQFVTSTHQIGNGKAAHAVPASHRPGMFILAVVIVLAIALWMHRHDKKKAKKNEEGNGQRGGRGGMGGQPAISGRAG